MDYIVHRRFKKEAICGSLNLRYGTKVEKQDDMLWLDDVKAICFATSENAKLHFSRNDDGMGLERGKLTYAIAYAPRKSRTGYRFNDEERKLLTEKYSHWLRQDTDYILFNDDFFGAPVDELRELAKRLNIKA